MMMYGALSQRKHKVMMVSLSLSLSLARSEKGRKHKKVKLHASLTASSSSTVAEEIVVLVRRLHPLRAWNSLINRYIGEHLRKIPHLIVAMPDNQPTPKKENKAVRNFVALCSKSMTQFHF